MYSVQVKHRINNQVQAQDNEFRENRYMHYYRDADGGMCQERFHLVNTNVPKNGTTQNQVTIPVDAARFGPRVTIRWYSDKPNVCQIALVTGGGKQSNIARKPFVVLECGTYQGIWREHLPMVCDRILTLRKEQQHESSQYLRRGPAISEGMFTPQRGKSPYST